MKDNLIKLCNSCFLGSQTDAGELAKQLLTPYVDEIKTDISGSIFGYIFGENDKNILLEAHIDEIGFCVTNVLPGGFLRLSAVGGIDIRTLPACKVIIHGKKDIKGVFTSTPPHLASQKQKEFSKLDEILVDTGLENVEEFVSVGDFATFDVKARDLQNGYFTAKSVDDRSGCVSLIEVAKRIKQNCKPKNNVIIMLASGEELGNRGAKIGAFDKQIAEAIAVDVSFGCSFGCNAQDCGKCEEGAMIGVSPILNKKMREDLEKKAKQNGIPYQFEAMSGLTSTDADVINITENGIKCALLSIPIKYMHTPIETVYLDDIKAVADLIFEYVK
ncbi:MAG: M20/M25/M40 family metallo-hydrolase [Clostridia bacterium]|nr:M20/M25/M40 family metallo-hydrolase [Clostridia bacterium]